MAGSDVPRGLRIAGTVIRTLFMCVLLAVIFRVASPQSETVWSAWETPGDLARIALGVVAAGWVVVNLFIPPKDQAAYRTWVYLGLVLLPLAAIWFYFTW